MTSELLTIIDVAKFQYFRYFGVEFILHFYVGISGWHAVQVLVLFEVFDIFWEFLDEELKGAFGLVYFIQFEAALTQQLVIHDLIFYLRLVSLQFLVHCLPPLGIPEDDDSIEIVVGELGGLQFCCLDEIIQR